MQGVGEVSVGGVEDERWGQTVCAVVRLQPDRHVENTQEGEGEEEEEGLGWLRKWCAPVELYRRFRRCFLLKNSSFAKTGSGQTAEL